MPFGTGPVGWYSWPYMAYWMRLWYPQWASPYFAPPWFSTIQDEEAFLKDQAKMLEDQLVQVKKRLEELKKQEEEKK